jgi:hypothetical protein
VGYVKVEPGDLVWTNWGRFGLVGYTWRSWDIEEGKHTTDHRSPISGVGLDGADELHIIFIGDNRKPRIGTVERAEVMHVWKGA